MTRFTSPPRSVRISGVVANDDGTESVLKPDSPRTPDHSPIRSPERQATNGDLEERIAAYTDALGPNSYRDYTETTAVSDGYLNDLPNVSYDGNYRRLSSSLHSSGSNQVTRERRPRSSTPRRSRLS